MFKRTQHKQVLNVPLSDVQRSQEANSNTECCLPLTHPRPTDFNYPVQIAVCLLLVRLLQTCFVTMMTEHRLKIYDCD